MTQPSLFPNKAPTPDEHVAKHQDKESNMQAVNSSINNIATRLKILEERYSTLRKKTQLTEQDIIESEKNNIQEIRLLGENIIETKRAVKDLREKIVLLSDEVDNFANKTDFIVLKKYVDMWQPMDFVTRKEINDFLRNKFNKINNNKKETKDNYKKYHAEN